MQDAKHTPLYDAHLRHGGKMVAFGGWALPVQYSGIVQEHQAVRTGAGIFDVSHMGEISVTGSDALAFLNALCTNAFDGMAVGRCRYSPVCYPDGGTVDDVIVYKRGEGNYLVIVNAANTDKDDQWMQAHREGYADLQVRNVSADYAQLALQGPAYMEILEKIGVAGTLPDKPYAFTEQARVAGVPCILSTTGYTGERGVEIYLAPADAAAVFDKCIAAGAAPCGLGARDTLRFEASMPLYGHELARDITPLEAGLKSFVKLDKPDFIGREALTASRARMRIGLELLDKGIAREQCDVYDEAGTLIGRTTSGGPAPSLGKNMAMALVPVDVAKDATLYIDVRGRKLKARRVPMPFYKAEA